MSGAGREVSRIAVVGAGIVGSWQALLFATAGYQVTLYDRDEAALTEATSYWAGGMLAPWCEREGAEPIVTDLGIRSLELWRQLLPETKFNGTLVVAHPRDRADLARFARLTAGFEAIDAEALARLEPALVPTFGGGLFFRDEGHVAPRLVLPALHRRIVAAGGTIVFQTECEPTALAGQCDMVIDCRGLAARDKFPDLRGVKGEMIVVETREVQLSRPVRLMHPRWPLYVIPRGESRFMLGATTIESEDEGVSTRSVLELLSAAYALHPGFAEARIVEVGAGLRPAFPDNLPRIAIGRSEIAVNGLYRHGFLLAPALAEKTLAFVVRGAIDNRLMRQL
jgi:glycine oxidase